MLDVAIQERLRALLLQAVEDLEKKVTIVMLLQSILPIVLTLLIVLFAENMLPVLALAIPAICLLAPLALSSTCTSLPMSLPENNVDHFASEYRFSPLYKLLQLMSESERHEIKLNILNCLYAGACGDVEALLSRTLTKHRKATYLEHYKLRKVVQEHAHRLLQKLTFACSISLLAISMLVPLVILALCEVLHLGHQLVKELSIFVIIPSCIGYLAGMRLVVRNIKRQVKIEEKTVRLEKMFEIMCLLGTVLGLIWVLV